MKKDQFATITRIKQLYLTGFLIILILPAVTFHPYFFPPDWGKTVIFRSILIILGLLFVFQLFFKKNQIFFPNFKKNYLAWTLGIFWILAFLATIFSTDSFFSLWGSPYRAGGFVNFTFYFFFAFLISLTLEKKDWLKIWNVSIATGWLVSLLAIIQHFEALTAVFAPVFRPPSTVGNPIILGVYLLFLIFISIALFIKEKNIFGKIWYGTSALLFIFVVLISGSRAAYLGFVLGAVYFFLFYPKKLFIPKIIGSVFLITVITSIIYINTQTNFPSFLEKSLLFQAIQPRLSVISALGNERFPAWKSGLKAALEKPLLGWGPENYSIGFDKHYEPTISNPWWDRAHNLLLDIAVTMGFPALVAFLAVFVIILYQLRKEARKSLKNIQEENSVTAHGLQSALIAYFTASLFSIDSFVTYLLFFLIIGYVFQATNTSFLSPVISLKNSHRKMILGILIVLAVFFLWQYNFKPLKINAYINKALVLTKSQFNQCPAAFDFMENIMPRRSILDSYLRLSYGEMAKNCTGLHPEGSFKYVFKAMPYIKEAAKKHPHYTRYWIFLGDGAFRLAIEAKNNQEREKFLTEAREYFDKALTLAPKHQEIMVRKIRLEIAAGNYQAAAENSLSCLELNKNFADCYWYLGLTNIYLKNKNQASENFKIALQKGYPIESRESLEQLSDAYGFLQDWKELVPIYKKLIEMRPNIAQYHSSLAFFYRELGQYNLARQEALKTLEISPESRPNVEEFLKTLPAIR